MTTVFPLFQQYIEPHLVHAHVGTRNIIVDLFFFTLHNCPIFCCYDASSKFVYLCILISPLAWQLKIQNDFDPVLSPESSLFVLKSKKQVNIQLYIPTFPMFTLGAK